MGVGGCGGVVRSAREGRTEVAHLHCDSGNVENSVRVQARVCVFCQSSILKLRTANAATLFTHCEPHLLVT